MRNLYENILALQPSPGDLPKEHVAAFARGHEQAKQAAASLVDQFCPQDLEDAFRVIAPGLQLALEMDALGVPEGTVVDLKRGLSLYHEWLAHKRQVIAENEAK